MKPQRLPLPPVPAAALLLLPVALLAALLLVVYPNEFALQASLAGAAACGDHQGGGGGGGVQAAPEFRLLIGVLTLPARYERRHLLRMVYALQQPAVASRAPVDVRFVFCRVGSPEDRVLVSLEAMAVPRLFGGGEAAYDFVMKADDDTFFRLPELAESLSRAPRRDLYYGCMVPCDYVRGSNEYMSGMGYLLSWDLVEWIVAAAAEIEGRTGGPEDRTLYSWLRRGGRGRNRVDVKPAMYNFPGRHPCSHEFIPDTIAVHQLKDNRRWARTLQYFNFTAALKPFYPPAVPPGVAQVDVRFVFCRVADPVDAQLVVLEAARHGDILVLNCTENMNDGKTHEYLSSVPRMFASSPYDYVMKTDDDTYLRVAALVDELRHKPRDDVYLGYGFAVGDDPMQFMHGMGYVVSWDVATWVSTNEDILRYNDTHGPEDLLVGKWLNIGRRGKNRYSLRPRMYDLNWDMDNFRPDTVLVHMLKDNRRWAAAFRYFNVNGGVQAVQPVPLPMIDQFLFCIF
ncbi:hypothetical protein OsJ_27846 [Oryza sativa Japonica Group]|uniref:Hexosyltransferase n=1 Tax=Oryza sativa subsp. japonica TaxID=39947 RepID=A3BUK8_ORYSJ|nr:hypothetical protein OsJ_27846 [Oryza sativa Japonica Group]